MRPSIGLKVFTPEFKRMYPRAMIRFNFWMFETLSYDPQVQINGLLIINTFKNVTMWDQMAMSSMAPMSDQIATFQHFQILGLRFKGAYILHQPSIMTFIWTLARPFMSQKFTSRFHLCGEDYSLMKSAFDEESRKLLPSDLEGDAEVNTSGKWVMQHAENLVAASK